MSTVRIAAIAGLALAAIFAITPAQALTMKQCSVKYKAAQDAGTLNGMKWNAFRKANCGTAATAATDTTAGTKDTATTTKTTRTTTPSTGKSTTANTSAPSGVVFPTRISPKYASESAGLARRDTCLDQYKINKARNALGGMKWIQKGGGYYSVCNARLKS